MVTSTHKLEYNRQYRKSHRKALNAYHKRWKAANANEDYMPNWRRKNRKRLTDYQRAYRRRTGAGKAWNALNNAINSGKIKRPIKCESCGKRRKVEGHHYKGYAKKNWLIVCWLCKECHSH